MMLFHSVKKRDTLTFKIFHENNLHDLISWFHESFERIAESKFSEFSHCIFFILRVAFEASVANNRRYEEKEVDVTFPIEVADPNVRQDVHSVSSLLKLYFRELPDPLCTYKLYDQFLEAARVPEDLRLSAMRQVVKALPKENFKWVFTKQCGNFRLFLSLRFYGKSFLGTIFEVWISSFGLFQPSKIEQVNQNSKPSKW